MTITTSTTFNLNLLTLDFENDNRKISNIYDSYHH